MKFNFYYYTVGCWVFGFSKGIYQTSNENALKSDRDFYKSKRLVTDKITWGIIKGIAYANPIFQPMILHSNLRQLEMKIRGMEDEECIDLFD
jgi:hypothetical protein